jgi:hypothetical protein
MRTGTQDQSTLEAGSGASVALSHVCSTRGAGVGEGIRCDWPNCANRRCQFVASLNGLNAPKSA